MKTKYKYLSTIIFILAFIAFLFALGYFWKKPCIEYYPLIEERNIDYIDCYKKDGTGPYYECGDMEVRCYKITDTEKEKQKVTCPF